MTEIIIIVACILALLVAIGAVLITIYIFRRNFRKYIFRRNFRKNEELKSSISTHLGRPNILYFSGHGALDKNPISSPYYLNDRNDVKWIVNYESSSKNKIEMIVDDKRQKFLSTPSIAFHYANEDQIKDFYNEYFKEPTIENLVSEVTGEVDGDVKGSFPQILEAHIGSKDISKWVSTIKLPDASLNGMFLRYQRETIKNNQVALGIEEVDIELTEFNAFEATIAELKERFDFEVDEARLDIQKTQLREKAAEKTLSKLEQATGWILIEGKFKIEIDGDFYRCTYLHPVNVYLPNQPNPVTISVLIPSKSLKEHIKGNYAQSIGRLIPLKIYGQVWQPLDRQGNVFDLQLTPLAIY